MKERLFWIDMLKGFGIVLVTFGHLSPNLLIEKHIYSFHMCLFFFVSGYLFTKSTNKIYIKKKIISLLIPFIVWNTICSSIELIQNHNLICFLQHIFLINGNLCWNAPLWFLWTLFLTEIIYYFLTTINPIHSKYISHCLLLASCFVLFIYFNSLTRTLEVNLLPLSLIFFDFGYIFQCLHKNKNRFKIIKKNNVLALLLYCSMIAINIVIGVFFNIRVSFTGAKFGNVYFFIISSICGVFGYFLLFERFSKYFPFKKLIATIGYSSMTIMIFQYPLFLFYNFIIKIFYDVNIWYYRNTLKAILLSAITILLIILGTKIIKNFFKSNTKYQSLLKYMGIR